MNKEDLIKFESEVVEMFNDGQLHSPIHLSGGDEEQLIEIFKKIKPTDWIFSNYRSHYHALLHGIDKEWLKNWILENKSIHVMNKEHKFFTSAIVAGCLPIALGTAIAIKKQNKDEKVWCFVGDMTANTGVFKECWQYAINNKLPIIFIVADNGLSTDTDTKEAWGFGKKHKYWFSKNIPKIIYYKYKRIYPHYGSGKFVSKIWEGIDETKKKGF